MSALHGPRWIATQATLLAMVLLAGLVAALTLSAPAPAGPDTLRLVGSASQAAAAAGSFRMDMDFSVKGSGFTMQLDGTAELDGAAREGRGEVDLPGGDTIRFLAADGRAYYRLPEKSGGAQWVGFPLPADDTGLMQDPLDFLRLLAGSNEVVDLGDEEVRGVAARRYRTEVDLPALVELVQQQGGSGMPVQVPRLEGDAHADVWLSEDGLPRRIRTEFTVQGITVVCSFDLFDYGVDVAVDPPAAGDVLEVDTQAEAAQLLLAG